MPRADSFWIGALTFLVYVACWREAWHPYDMSALLNCYVRDGGADHPYYTFFTPLLALAHAVVAPFGGGVFQGGLLLSAGGSAIGVLCAHVAARTLGLDRRSSAFAALLVATLPAVFYFAVIVEVHGLVLGICGVAWVAIARWVRRPTMGRAFVAGLALALAFLAHPVAGALGGVMWPLSQIVQPEMRWRQRLRGGGIALLPVLVVVGWWLVRRSWVPVRNTDALDLLVSRWAGERPGFGASIVREWIVPFTPVSVLLLGGLFVRAGFRAAATMLLATLPFVVAGWSVLLTAEWEYGAYCAIVSGPTAIVAAWVCRPAWLRLLALVGALGGAGWLCAELQPTPEAVATDAAMRAAIGTRRAFWVIGDGAGPDGQAWLTRHHRLPGVVLADILMADPDVQAEGLRAIDRAIAVHAASGELAVVTSTTVDTLTGLAPLAAGARTMLDWLSQRKGEVLAEVEGLRVFAVRAP